MSFIFPCDVFLHEILVIVVDLLASASSATTGPGVTQPISDLEALEQSIKSVTAMLDRVLSYVRSVLAGEVKGDPAVGRYLLDTFAASTDDLEKGGFNASLQVNQSCTSLNTSD